MNNQKRFEILRGYYDDNGFHSMGRDGKTETELLDLLEFSNLEDFSNWYKSLSPEEIGDGKKEWCPGDCCQSILKRLLELAKI